MLIKLNSTGDGIHWPRLFHVSLWGKGLWLDWLGNRAPHWHCSAIIWNSHVCGWAVTWQQVVENRFRARVPKKNIAGSTKFIFMLNSERELFQIRFQKKSNLSWIVTLTGVAASKRWRRYFTCSCFVERSFVHWLLGRAATWQQHRPKVKQKRKHSNHTVAPTGKGEPQHLRLPAKQS